MELMCVFCVCVCVLIVEGDQTFLLGEQGEYEPVSRLVYNELNKTKSGH